jgi:hypothetical protein
MVDVESQRIYIFPIIHPNQERPTPVNPIPQSSEAKPNLARTLRESCVRFTEAADESFFFRAVYLLLARLFGRIETMFLAWQDGKLIIVQAAPRTTTQRTNSTSRHKSARHRGTRRPKSVSSNARPTSVRRQVARQHETTLRPQAPTPRIDRYPKP